MTTTRERSTESGQTPVAQQVVHFAFYKLRPDWWTLPPTDRRAIAEEFGGLLQQWRQQLILVAYSLTGLRADCDLMLWKAADSVDQVQELGLAIARSRAGRYLQPAYAYLSLTKRSVYIREHEHPGEPGDRSRIKPVGSHYLFVYPFVKTRAWYALPLEKRQEMMSEHIRVGHKYPRVRLNTTYSFGLDDQEFVLAFETDHPSDFLDLVMELRETEASGYTLRDTPIFTCVKAEGDALLRALGAEA
jgi:chlorite dismutase